MSTWSTGVPRSYQRDPPRHSPAVESYEEGVFERGTPVHGPCHKERFTFVLREVLHDTTGVYVQRSRTLFPRQDLCGARVHMFRIP